MKNRIKKTFRRGKKGDKSQKGTVQEAPPRITNETVAVHREEVLSSARKYIYPLQHSKHKIVLVSITLFIVVIVAFFSYCAVALYRLQDSSTFLYRVTQVVPFPVARAAGGFVSYEDYLFELRHYQHYYETQLKVNFDAENEKQQLDEYKHRALDKVINDAYVKQLAKENGITVSETEVNDQITILRAQNRLGSSDKVFEDVIKDYWGWSLEDFKRTLRQQILAQKVVAKLDTETQARADAALGELKSGADFAAVAKKYSDDPSKDNGGEYGFPIDKTSRDVSAIATDALYRLKPGEYSMVVNTGYSLEIYKVIEVNGDKLRAARIVFNYKPIEQYINDRKDKQPARTFITLPKVEEAPTETTAPAAP